MKIKNGCIPLSSTLHWIDSFCTPSGRVTERLNVRWIVCPPCFSLCSPKMPNICKRMSVVEDKVTFYNERIPFNIHFQLFRAISSDIARESDVATIFISLYVHHLTFQFLHYMCLLVYYSTFKKEFLLTSTIHVHALPPSKTSNKFPV